MEIVLETVATDENFDEANYLAANPDVAAAVKAGTFSSGRAHFRASGRAEQRRLRSAHDIEAMRRRKLDRLIDRLNLDLPHVRKGLKFDFLTDELRRQTGIVDTDAISSNAYDSYVEAIIRDNENGLVLDCGAGRRGTYYDNVVNYEIVDYDTTDIIGVGESLPFKDNSFDAVISVAVLEHVRDPFTCAAEIVRVLRPNGKLFCAVPFLQPEHGYPHHYYNMAPQGLRALFERSLVIDDHKVYAGVLPVWALRWIVKSWAAGLVGKARRHFLALRLEDLIRPAEAPDVVKLDWVAELSERKNFELACATVLFAHKPSEVAPPPAPRSTDHYAVAASSVSAPVPQSSRHGNVAAWFGAEQFFWRPEQDAEQDSRIGDLRSFIRNNVVKDRPSVEIGPSFAPVIPKRDGYQATVVDHADAPTLKEKYGAQNVDVSGVEAVDVVWSGGKLAPAMPHRDMAAVVACHMIEHAPDFVGFLDDCTDMLAGDGRILLIVPDRRYCFDFMHPASDVAKVVEDYRLQRKLHSFGSLFRLSTVMAAQTNGASSIAWGQHAVDDINFLHGDPTNVIAGLCEATEYIDAHENYFTPSSFVLLIEELRYMGLLRLAPEIVTRARNCEFLVVLKKREQPERPSLADYLERKKFLVLNMLREERERLQFLGTLLDG